MKKVICIIILMLSSVNVWAVVAAHVDRTQVSLGESLTLTIDTPNNSTQPDVTPLDKAFQVYGTSSSSSTTIINGKTTAKHQIIITLMPKHLGILIIPALTVGTDKTQPISITVTKPSATTLGGSNSNAFIRASVSSKAPYVSSPIVYTLKLYFANTIEGGNIIPAKTQGFTIKPYGKQQTYSAEVDSKMYRVVEQHYLLTVEHAGHIDVPGVAFQGSFVTNNTNTMFGFTQTKPVRIVSNSISLKVKSIPAAIDANSWLPARQVTLESTLSPESQQLQVGQPITRTVTLTAIGVSAKDLPDIHFTVPTNVNAYPDQAKTNEKVVDGQLVAQKIYKIAYVPTAKGQLLFPEIAVPWWNITTHHEIKASIPSKTYPVLAGKLSSQITVINHPAIKTTTIPVKTKIEKVYVAKKFSPVWQWLTYLLWCLWLVTITGYFFKRRKSVISKKNGLATEDNGSRLLQAMQKACQTTDSKLIQQTFLAWAKVHWANKLLLSLGEVTKLIDDESFVTLVCKLDQRVYSDTSFTEGETLWKALQAYLLSQKKEKGKAILKPLYPE